MGFKLLDLKLPTDYSPDVLRKKIGTALRIREFSYTIEKQSLDARKKSDIHWQVRAGVSSPELKGADSPARPIPIIEYRRRTDKNRVVVAGSGPAGFFAAYGLQRAGFSVTLLEQGADVDVRFSDIREFERGGAFREKSNYAFGEGGAGTFSDGKLTSRTKTISRERDFIFYTCITAGAPPEIAFLAHPHLGSDNLRNMVKQLRLQFQNLGGRFHFNEGVTDIQMRENRVSALETAKQVFPADYAIFAPGHSSRETYKMLMRRGVGFRVKPFALGCRVEHEQELINQAQWGRPRLPGVKAAEYRLSCSSGPGLPVYSFCMCPGGKVVPAAVYPGTNIVNGMSDYARNSRYANAAIVAGVHPHELAGKEMTPPETLDWLHQLESAFYEYSGGYAAPASPITDFLRGKAASRLPETSYPLGLTPADYRSLLPLQVYEALKLGMTYFKTVLKGFENGVALGLESKTSSPIQGMRNPCGLCEGFSNLFLVGEGSGFAGGIVSSAADGLKTAFYISAL